MAIKLRPAEEPTIVGKAPPESEAAKGNGLEEGITTIPPPDAAKKPSRFAKFKVKDAVVPTAAGQAAVVEVKKPDSGVFFRMHPSPEMYEPVWCFEQKAGGKRLFLIDPDLCGLPELEGMVKRIMFAPYITQFGGMGLWPISIDYEEMAWIKSALHICDQAKAQWVTAISVKKQQAYRLQPAATGFGEPPWPTPLEQDKLLELAFREDEWIEDRDHSALKRLRGEKE